MTEGEVLEDRARARAQRTHSARKRRPRRPAGRKLATILAALRYWQRTVPLHARLEDQIATDGGTCDPLDDREIDQLCEEMNQ